MKKIFVVLSKYICRNFHKGIKKTAASVALAAV